MAILGWRSIYTSYLCKRKDGVKAPKGKNGSVPTRWNFFPNNMLQGSRQSPHHAMRCTNTNKSLASKFVQTSNALARCFYTLLNTTLLLCFPGKTGHVAKRIKEMLWRSLPRSRNLNRLASSLVKRLTPYQGDMSLNPGGTELDKLAKSGRQGISFLHW